MKQTLVFILICIGFITSCASPSSDLNTNESSESKITYYKVATSQAALLRESFDRMDTIATYRLELKHDPWLCFPDPVNHPEELSFVLNMHATMDREYSRAEIHKIISTGLAERGYEPVFQSLDIESQGRDWQIGPTWHLIEPIYEVCRSPDNVALSQPHMKPVNEVVCSVCEFNEQ